MSGTARVATDKESGEKLACKTIAKNKLRCKEQGESVKREVEIMGYLAGHPNVTQIKAAFEGEPGLQPLDVGRGQERPALHEIALEEAAFMDDQVTGGRIVDQ